MNEPNVSQRLSGGSAILDGYPIVWTEVMQSFATSAARPVLFRFSSPAMITALRLSCCGS